MKLIVFLVGILLILVIKGESNQSKVIEVEENTQQKANNLQNNDVIVVNAPNTVDWRAQGLISPVKDQGKCFAQSAFSAASQLQTVYYSYKSRTIDISQQYFLSCGSSLTPCSGIYQYAKKNLLDVNSTKKISLQSALPYKSSDLQQGTISQQCDKISTMDISNIKYSSVLHQNISEDSFIQLISNYPVLVEIRANQQFYNYKQGIFQCLDENAEYENYYYGVQVVGYNKNERYYTVKNSMGSSWGENGFARISMDKDCGIKRYVIELTYQGENKNLSAKSVFYSSILLVLAMIVSW